MAEPAYTLDDLVPGWLEQLESIEQQLGQLIYSRRMFLSLTGFLGEHSEFPNPEGFFTWVIHTYGEAALIGYRRVIDSTKKSISLKKLLHSIREHHALITRAWFVSHANSVTWAEDIADQWYSDHVGMGEQALPLRVVQSHLDSVNRHNRAIEDYATRRIAHNSIRKVPNSPTFKEINDALAECERIYLFYRLLLTSSGMESVAPAIEVEWTKLFKVPLVGSVNGDDNVSAGGGI